MPSELVAMPLIILYIRVINRGLPASRLENVFSTIPKVTVFRHDCRERHRKIGNQPFLALPLLHRLMRHGVCISGEAELLPMNEKRRGSSWLWCCSKPAGNGNWT